MELNSYISVVIFIHSIFFLILVVFKRKADISNYVIFIFFLFIFHFVSRPSIDTFENKIPIFYRFISYAWVLPQLLYIFTYSKIYNILSWRHFIHFIPVLSIGIYYSIFESDPKSQSYKIFFLNPSISPSLFGRFHTIIGIIFAVYYTIISWKIIKEHVVAMKDIYSSLNYFRTLNWLKGMCYYFFGFNLFLLSIMLFYKLSESYNLGFVFKKEYYSLIQNILFSFTIYLFTFFIFLEQEYISTEISTEEPILKYSKTGLKKEKSEKLLQEIKSLVERDKLYLNEELRIHDIAKELNESINYISQTLNELEGKNFHQFINEYRIKEVIQRFSNPEFNEYPILRIAFDSGFNSKSSFNKVFKEQMGISPKDFRKNL
jgi:AraC-like DNA-binding protein